MRGTSTPSAPASSAAPMGCGRSSATRTIVVRPAPCAAATRGGRSPTENGPCSASSTTASKPAPASASTTSRRGTMTKVARSGRPARSRRSRRLMGSRAAHWWPSRAGVWRVRLLGIEVTMDATTVLALVLALVSTTLINLAYLREHEAAAAMPALSLRRPIQSVILLFSDRSWLAGFAMESGGFILYAIALALASLALVQSISAGGIGVLAFVSARMAARPLTRRELSGVLIAVVGLVALAVSLAGGSD